MSVTYMSRFFGNCKFRSPEQALEDAKQECKERGIKKIVVLMLPPEGGDGHGDYTFHAAGIDRKDGIYLATRFIQDQ